MYNRSCYVLPIQGKEGTPGTPGSEGGKVRSGNGTILNGRVFVIE